MTVTKHKRIAAGSTIPLISTSIALVQLVIVVSNAGTSWVVRIEDNASSPAIIVPAVTLAVPSGGAAFTEHWDEPLPMDGGLDFVTVSGTPGVADVWFSYAQPST